MVKSAYLLVLFAVLLIGSVVVTSIAVTDLYRSAMPSSCEEFLARNSFIWLPGKVSDLFYGDRINLHFSMMDGNVISINGIVTDGAITDLNCLGSPDYDFDVSMSDVNALQLATSTKPTTTFVTLWREGEIEIEPRGSANAQKLTQADRLLAEDDEPVPEWIRLIFGRYVED